MTFRYFTGTSIVTSASTSAITANDGDQIIIAPGAIVVASGSGTSNGINAAADLETVDILVQGTLAGSYYGIDLYSAINPSITAVLQVSVAQGGSVISGTGNAILLSGARATLLNDGRVESLAGSGFTVFSAAETSIIHNTGSIISGGSAAAIRTSSNTSTTIVNTGIISATQTTSGSDPYGAIYLTGIGNDTIWNSGSIFGNVALGAGDDLFQGPGRVFGNIGSTTSSIGNDTIVGSAFDDTIIDNAGGNWLIGGDGADTITIGNGFADFQIDHVFGGIAGGADTSLNDTLAFANETGGLGVNVFLAGGYVTTAAGLIAVFTGIENATGSSLADGIFGTAGANVINGGDGNDWLVGNGGADTFVFSLVTHADGDNVRDLRRSEGDRIDLSQIDANSASTADDAFVFRTTHTTNAAGEMVVINYGTSAVVNLYTNADDTIDGSFVVVFGEAGMTNLTAADFFL